MISDIEPYYQTDDGMQTIYCGDSMELLPLIEPGSVDLVLSDPPYGINYGTTAWSRGAVIGDDKPFNPQFMNPAEQATILWGANNYCHSLPIGGWLVWMKHTDSKFLANWQKSDAELAWTNITRKVLVNVHLWSGAIREDPMENGILLPHPTQKPMRLMKWCIEISKTTGAVLDPFLGSGTTLVACQRLGRRGIGIEISEAYCEIAKKRLAQYMLPGIHGSAE